MRVIKYFFSFLTLLGSPIIVSARDFSEYVKLKCDSIPNCLELLLRYAVTLALPLGVIYVIWSGFLFVFAQGNEQKIAQAKKNLSWTLIGLAVVVGAWALAVAFKGFFTGL